MTKKHPSKNTQFPQGVVATKQEINHYQGPVPHPDILRGFDELVPGAAERLINWQKMNPYIGDN